MGWGLVMVVEKKVGPTIRGRPYVRRGEVCMPAVLS